MTSLLEDSLCITFNKDNGIWATVGVGCQQEWVHAHQPSMPLDKLDGLTQQDGHWCYTVLSYDLKDHIEKWGDQGKGAHTLPVVLTVIPRFVFRFAVDRQDPGFLILKGDFHELAPQCYALMSQIREAFSASTYPSSHLHQSLLQPTLDAPQYYKALDAIRGHLQRGDIYEVNYCHEFASHTVLHNPFGHWLQLMRRTSAPFSAYLQHRDWVLMCASPERFLQRKGQRLLSQPIKGTIRRSQDAAEDEALRQQLLHSQKDRSENVMIVDLVRNDLSRLALPQTVEVTELFGVYPFKTVHHLISSITATIPQATTFADILGATFPMGSMTGAPKVSAMQIAEQFENFRRGWYAGSIGFRSPRGDFDMNVIIRSAVFQKSIKRLTCGVGGAITMASIATQEYEETLLKAEAIRSTFTTE